MTCQEVELSLGVLVLGAIDPAERTLVEAHLAACPRCKRVLTELAPLPGLLHRLDPVDVGEPVVADRRRRIGVLLGAAASVALLAALLAVAGPRLLEDGAPAPLRVSATDPATEVSAAARLAPAGSGTQVSLELSGVSPGEHCRLVVVGAGGRREVAASWVATYAGRASVTAQSGIRPDQVRRLDVVTTTGRTLVQVPVSS